MVVRRLLLAILPTAAAAEARCADWACVRAHAAEASSRFPFPAFYVGGAAKCGTTTLSSWFSLHPQVVKPLQKEPFYFTREAGEQASGREAYMRTLGLEEWWANGSLATFDGTASYVTTRGTGTMASLFAANPKIKFVLVFREPVTRAISYLQHAAANVLKSEKRGHAPKGGYPDCLARRSLAECADLDLIAPNLERYGRVAGWLEVFPRDQFFFVTMERMVADPAAVFAAMQAFLGLATFVDLDFDAAGHRRSADLPYNMSSARYARLVAAAAADARDLDAATGDANFTAGWRDLWRAQQTQCDSPHSGRVGECYIFMQDPPALSRTQLLDAVATRTFPVREPP